jgi:hypothetical protein
VHVHQLAGAVDVAGPQVQPLGHAQSEGVEGPEVGAVVRGADGVDEATHLLDGEDVGERLLLRDSELPEGGPVAWGDASEEEADAVEGDLEGCGSEVLLVLEEEQVLAQLGLGDLVRRLAEVGGELADGAQVRLLGALAEAGELQLLAHALA